MLNMDNSQKLFLSFDEARINDSSASKEENNSHSMKGGHHMTYMQNLYAQHMEKVRSDRANEALKRQELEETQRSHLVNEALSERDLQEKIRHQITQDTETMRHNLASEQEIALHNRNTEELQSRANDIALIGHELNYKAQHERTVTTEDIAKMENATKLYLESAKNRIAEANSKSERSVATAKLMEAKAKIDTAEAALRNAAVNEDIAPSQKYANIGRGTRDLIAGVESVSDIVQDWIPQTKAANTATDAIGKASKNASKTGKKNAKATGKDVQDILRKSGYGDSTN